MILLEAESSFGFIAERQCNEGNGIAEIHRPVSGQQHSPPLARLQQSAASTNRTELTCCLEQAFSRRNATSLVAVIPVGLDNWNEIVDAVGPSAADQILVQVSRRLQDVIQNGKGAKRILLRSALDEVTVVAEGLRT